MCCWEGRGTSAFLLSERERCEGEKHSAWAAGCPSYLCLHCHQAIERMCLYWMGGNGEPPEQAQAIEGVGYTPAKLYNANPYMLKWETDRGQRRRE